MSNNQQTVKITSPAKPGQKKPLSARVGGSYDENFNMGILDATIRAFWVPSCESAHHQELEDHIHTMATNGLDGIRPKNELEGMLAAQIVAAHAASMECYRRAARPEQTSEGRDMNLRHAVKASRTFGAHVETLLKLRGESGKQSVHVHHHHHETDNRTQVAAEKAIVRVAAPGAGEIKNQGQPHEPEAMSDENVAPFDIRTALRGEEQAGEPLPMPSDERKKEV